MSKKIIYSFVTVLTLISYENIQATPEGSLIFGLSPITTCIDPETFALTAPRVAPQYEGQVKTVKSVTLSQILGADWQELSTQQLDIIGVLIEGATQEVRVNDIESVIELIEIKNDYGNLCQKVGYTFWNNMSPEMVSSMMVSSMPPINPIKINLNKEQEELFNALIMKLDNFLIKNFPDEKTKKEREGVKSISSSSSSSSSESAMPTKKSVIVLKYKCRNKKKVGSSSSSSSSSEPIKSYTYERAYQDSPFASNPRLLPGEVRRYFASNRLHYQYTEEEKKENLREYIGETHNGLEEGENGRGDRNIFEEYDEREDLNTISNEELINLIIKEAHNILYLPEDSENDVSTLEKEGEEDNITLSDIEKRISTFSKDDHLLTYDEFLMLNRDAFPYFRRKSELERIVGRINEIEERKDKGYLNGNLFDLIEKEVNGPKKKDVFCGKKDKTKKQDWLNPDYNEDLKVLEYLLDITKSWFGRTSKLLLPKLKECAEKKIKFPQFTLTLRDLRKKASNEIKKMTNSSKIVAPEQFDPRLSYIMNWDGQNNSLINTFNLDNLLRQLTKKDSIFDTLKDRTKRVNFMEACGWEAGDLIEILKHEFYVARNRGNIALMDFLREVILDIYNNEDSYTEISLPEGNGVQKFDEENTVRTAVLLFEPILISNPDYKLEWSKQVRNNLTQIFSNCVDDIVNEARKNLSNLSTRSMLDIFTGKDTRGVNTEVESLLRKNFKIINCGTEQFYNEHYVYFKCLYNSSFQFMLKHNMFPGVFYLNRLLESTLKKYDLALSKKGNELFLEIVPLKENDNSKLPSEKDRSAILNRYKLKLLAEKTLLLERIDPSLLEKSDKELLKDLDFETVCELQSLREKIKLFGYEIERVDKCLDPINTRNSIGIMYEDEGSQFPSTEFFNPVLINLFGFNTYVYAGIYGGEPLLCNLFGPFTCCYNDRTHFQLIRTNSTIDDERIKAERALNREPEGHQANLGKTTKIAQKVEEEEEKEKASEQEEHQADWEKATAVKTYLVFGNQNYMDSLATVEEFKNQWIRWRPNPSSLFAPQLSYDNAHVSLLLNKIIYDSEPDNADNADARDVALLYSGIWKKFMQCKAISAQNHLSGYNNTQKGPTQRELENEITELLILENISDSSTKKNTNEENKSIVLDLKKEQLGTSVSKEGTESSNYPSREVEVSEEDKIDNNDAISLTSDTDIVDDNESVITGDGSQEES